MIDLLMRLVVGQEEKESRGVNIRNRDDQSKQKKDVAMPLVEAVRRLEILRDEKKLVNVL